MSNVASVAVVGPIQPRTMTKHTSKGFGNWIVVDVAMSGAYATGGDSVNFATNAATAGLIGQRTGGSGVQPTWVFPAPSAGYVFEWDGANNKIKAYRQSAATSALTEPNGVSLTGVTTRCLIFY